MFTGIITDIGTVTEASRPSGADLRLRIRAAGGLPGLVTGASVACAGVCLTATAIEGDSFTVDVSDETLARSVAGHWQKGSHLNLERALRVGDELGGHIVTGHVDGVGTVVGVAPADGSTHVAIRAPGDLAGSIAAKGSITVDGVSLTVNAVEDGADGADGTLFHLNIIPHTTANTTLAGLQPGQQVNLEIDLLARYLARLLTVQHSRTL